ncbi:MAG: AraC family transcriptional regulator [Eubacteriales bacterium]|nr:AraC family transcriptional regulator [Eubacteriales bacterium]
MKEAELMAVQRMQEYIDAHIDEKITLAQLAAAAGYSPWHAARLFSEAAGKPPFEYIRSLRLTAAALVLRDRRVRIIDVALDFVFDSHEGFTRAFAREFGLTPSEYSRRTPPLRLFMPPKVYDTRLALAKRADTQSKERENGGKKMPERKTVFVQVMERPARKLLLKRARTAEDYFEFCEEAGCDVWSVLTGVKEAIHEPVGLWLPEHLITEGTSRYVQGVEVPPGYANEIPDGYELIDLPPCRMMVFQGEPYNDDDFMEEIGELWEHIKRFDPTLYGYRWAPESAPRYQLAPMGYRGYIEARPVEPLN